MGSFEELGKRLDKLADQVRAATQSGIERTTNETKEWRRHLDELGERIRKTTQEGFEKFTTETREFGQITKLRSQIREIKRKLDEKFKKMGQISFALKVHERVEEEELKNIAREIVDLEEQMKEKENQVKKLKSG